PGPGAALLRRQALLPGPARPGSRRRTRAGARHPACLAEHARLPARVRRRRLERQRRRPAGRRRHPAHVGRHSLGCAAASARRGAARDRGDADGAGRERALGAPRSLPDARDRPRRLPAADALDRLRVRGRRGGCGNGRGRDRACGGDDRGCERRRGERARLRLDGQPARAERNRRALPDLRARRPDPGDGPLAVGARAVTRSAGPRRQAAAACAAAVCLAAAGLALPALVGGAATSGAAADRLLGPTPPAQTVDALLVLRLKEPALRRYLQGLDDPRSPVYGHYGDAASFGRRFGLADAELRRLRRALSALGLRVLRGYPQRTALRVRGSAAAVGRLFSVTLRDFETPSGAAYHAPTGPARVPHRLARWVAAVADLDTRPLPAPADVPARVPGSLLGAGALAPDDAAAAYDVTPLRRAGANGSGQTIAVVSFDSFVDSDIADFDRRFGIAGPAPKHVPVAGGGQIGGGHGEVDLDVQVIRGIAPGAQIVSYEAPPDGSLADVFNAILAGPATVVSNSWGICAAQLVASVSGDAEQTDTNEALQVAAYRGVTGCSAAGDAGAYDCERRDFSDHTLQVEYPAASPWVVAVGGTVLSVRQDGSYLEEAGWQDPLTNGGGGGGVNTLEARPPWQRGPGIDPAARQRGLPDVSAAAGIDSPWAVYVDGALRPVYGTSAATPFWAASMLLAQQYMVEHEHAGPLCFAAPLLYRLAASRQRFAPFHDVTRGGNRFYPAGPGWDFATGLGSPDVWNLARDLAAYRTAHPLPQANDACRAQASQAGAARPAADTLHLPRAGSLPTDLRRDEEAGGAASEECSPDHRLVPPFRSGPSAPLSAQADAVQPPDWRGA